MDDSASESDALLPSGPLVDEELQGQRQHQEEPSAYSLRYKPSYGALAGDTDLPHIGFDQEHRSSVHSKRRNSMLSSLRRKRSRVVADIPLADTAAAYQPVSGDQATLSDTDNGDTNAIVDDDDDDEEDTLADDSPYDEVRACVPPVDDSSLPVSTVRMWVLATVFTVIGSSVNLLFSLRYPSIFVNAIIAQLLSHPAGRAWHKWMPYNVRFLGMRIPLNIESEWNVKEHACVFMAANVSFGFAYATDILTEQIKFYGQDLGLLYQVLFTLSSQILGYAIAGFCSGVLVYPSSMIWPSCLVNCALFQVLHSVSNVSKPSLAASISTHGKNKLFLPLFVGAFAWHFLPAYVMPFLSNFNVATWFDPQNATLANFFGVKTGLGLLPLTFDWGQVAYIGSPLMVPWWAMGNVFVGFVVIGVVMSTIFLYMNVWNAKHMPILSSEIYDNTGNIYNVSRILKLGNSSTPHAPSHGMHPSGIQATLFTGSIELDVDRYNKYSPMSLPIVYALSIGTSFASLAALVVHCILYHGPVIRDRIRSQKVNGPNGHPLYDVHMRLTAQYKSVPFAWYFVTFLIPLACAFYVCIAYPLGLPWHGLALSIIICVTFFIPIGLVAATSNQTPSTLLLCQLVAGYLYPGSPTGNMIFHTYGYITGMQGLKFSGDMKLGMYLKVPPRTMFAVQVYATVVGSLVQVATLNHLLRAIPRICTLEAAAGFICPFARVHFNSSVMWGLIGPERIFGTGGVYHSLLYAFVIGVVLPIPVWLMERRARAMNKTDSVWRWINLPVILGGLVWIPPASGLNFTAWFLVGAVSNLYVRRCYNAFWQRNNFVISAALDAAVALALVVGFFVFVESGLYSRITWWPSTIFKDGCDWRGCALAPVKKGEHF